jgi:hypothetical protein
MLASVCHESAAPSPNSRLSGYEKGMAPAACSQSAGRWFAPIRRLHTFLTISQCQEEPRSRPGIASRLHDEVDDVGILVHDTPPALLSSPDCASQGPNVTLPLSRPATIRATTPRYTANDRLRLTMPLSRRLVHDQNRTDRLCPR